MNSLLQNGWNIRKIPDYFCFAAGLGILLMLLAAMWGGSSAVVPYVSQWMKYQSVHEYGCLGADCERCLRGIDRQDQGVILAGASGAIYALDTRLLQFGSQPLINCMINQVQLDNFTGLLNVRDKVKEGHVFLHAINSWSMITHPPPPRRFFATSDEADAFRILNAIDLGNSYFESHFSQMQLRWRAWLPAYQALAFFPMSQTAHIEAKQQLMQRWIRASPWAKVVFGNVESVPTKDELRRRLTGFKDHLRPASRHIFVNLPENTAVIQAQRERIFEQSKKLFAETVGELQMEYVDVDYARCGLSSVDFWTGSASYAIDPMHLNGGSKKEAMTNCLRTELLKRGLLN